MCIFMANPAILSNITEMDPFMDPQPVLRIRIRRIRMFLALLDPDPDPPIRGTDPPEPPDPDPLVRVTDPPDLDT